MPKSSAPVNGTQVAPAVNSTCLSRLHDIQTSHDSVKMCGRYVLALRYGQVHDVLEQHGLPADDFHEQRSRRNDANDGQQGDEDTEGDEGAEGPQDEGVQDADEAKDTGDAIFQPSYNFAPGYRGIILRPVFPTSRSYNTNKKPNKSEESDNSEKQDAYGHGQLHLQLQVMKWGLVPSWMKKRPDYATMLKTINCRADSIAAGSGMWASLRGRKRCIVVAQGFYEWLKTGPKERVPHYIRRRDGLPLLLAGLWDSVSFEGDEKSEKSERTYTYTIITTDSNASLRFLHDRMPVVFDYQSPELQMWLDPKRDTWTPELQALLRPWPRMADDDGGALIVDVVSKDVNKAGHSSPSFIVPVASESNKSNIANFFRGGKTEKMEKTEMTKKREAEEAEEAKEIDAEQPSKRRRLASPLADSISPEKAATATTATSATPTTPVKNMVSTRPASVSSTSKGAKEGSKGSKATARTPNKKDDKSGNSQKITSFFGLKNTS